MRQHHSHPRDTPSRAGVNIGAAARRSGITIKMIRYYESIGLVAPADRTAGNYRTYDERDISRLEFVKRSRNLGFSLDEIRQLLALWDDSGRASAEVKSLVLSHIAELDARIAALKGIRGTLRHLAERCDGDDRPDCPIIERLADTDLVSGHGCHPV
jgi:MerR family transcriptional regulator, copper efflux regulator